MGLMSRSAWILASASLLTLVLVLHFAGNSTYGYVASPSLWRWWLEQWLSPHAEMQHGPLVVLGAVWLGRVRSRGLVPRGEARLSLSLGGAGWLLHVFGFWIQMPRLSAAALLVLGGSLAAAWGGRAALRAWAPALALVLFSLSWGFVDTLGLGVAVREGVAWSVQQLAGAWDIALVRHGTQLLPPGGGEPLEVAAACSGVRSLSALLALTWFAAFREPFGWRRRFSLAAIAFGLVALGNLVRVGGTVFWSLRQGHPLSEGVHEALGLAVFALEAILLFELGLRGAKTRPQPAPDASPSGISPDYTESLGWFCGLGVLACAFLLTIGAHQPTVTAKDPELPLWIGPGWSSKPAGLAPAEKGVLPADTRFARRVYEPLGRPDGALLATILQAGRDRTSFHRPELCLAGLGWTVVERRRVYRSTSGLDATVLVLSREDGRLGVMVYWYAQGSRTEPTYGHLLRAWISETFRRYKSAPWRYWSTQTLVGAEGLAPTVERALDLAEQLWAPVNRHEPPQVESEHVEKD